MKQKQQYVTKYTAFNVLANIFLILFFVGVIANKVLVKLDMFLKETYVKFAPAEFFMDKVIGGWAMPSSLIAIGVLVVSLGLIILAMFLAKKGKGWNLIPFAFIFADALYFMKSFIEKWGEYQDGYKSFQHIFQNPEDINLFVHVIVLLFVSFAAARGTKKIPVTPEATPENGYRNVTIKRKISPFGRNQEFECWLNGENLAALADGQEKNFLVDRYGAELVIVSPSGEESNIVDIPEGKDDVDFVLTTARSASGKLVLNIQQA